MARSNYQQRNQAAHDLGIHPWDDFADFLEGENCTEQFFQNHELLGDRTITEIKAGNPWFYMSEAFYWNESAEGYHHWRELANKWTAICERRKYASRI